MRKNARGEFLTITARILPVKVLALLSALCCTSAFAVDYFAFPSEKEIRQKLETAILDPSSRFQDDGVVLFPAETIEFHTKTLSITKSRSTSEPLVLFCGTSGPENRPDVESDNSDDICGLFDLKNSLVYILSNKTRPDIAIRPFPLSKTADFILLEGVCGRYSCKHDGISELFEYNGSSGTLSKIWATNTYNHISADGCDSSSEYIDRGVLSEGIRGAENMREIVLSINREDKHSEPPQEIKEIKEWYGWKNGRPYLVQRSENARLVLDRAAAERIYAISQIDVSTTAPGRMVLIDYLADENPMVITAANHAIYSHMRAMEKTGEMDYLLISELVRRYLDKNSPCRSGAGNLLSNARALDGFSLAKDDRDLLWNAYSGGGADDFILQLLSSSGDERALKPLLERFEAAVDTKDSCAADEAYIHINNLVGKGVPLGTKEKSVLKKAAQSNLVCIDGSELNVSRNIAVWLDPTPRKLPTDCAPRENLPEVIQQMFAAKEGFSGIEYLGGGSKGYCQDSLGCKSFTKNEIYNLLIENLAKSGQWVDAALDSRTDDALFGIQYCRLESDYVKYMRDTEDNAILSSKYNEQNELKDFLSTLLGEWCGRNQERPNHAQAQVRISFIQDKGIIKGSGTITFANIGAPGYVIPVILIPISYNGIAKSKEVLFSEVSRYTPGQSWQLREINGDLHLYNSHWGDTMLSHACDGFWKEGN